MKIQYVLVNPMCRPEMHGNLFDLKSAENVTFEDPKLVNVVGDNEFEKRLMWDEKIVSLGIIMKLPKYLRADLQARSSTYTRHKLIMGNSRGIIDGDTKLSNMVKGIELGKNDFRNIIYKCDKGYNGQTDVLKIPLLAISATEIKIGDRIAQFELVLTMDAPWWFRLKWALKRKIIFEEVALLHTSNRNGFGSSGK